MMGYRHTLQACLHYSCPHSEASKDVWGCPHTESSIPSLINLVENQFQTFRWNGRAFSVIYFWPSEQTYRKWPIIFTGRNCNMNGQKRQDPTWEERKRKCWVTVCELQKTVDVPFAIRNPPTFKTLTNQIAVFHHKNVKSNILKMDPHKNVESFDSEALQNDWREQVCVGQSHEGFWQDFITMIQEFEHMFDERHGIIVITEHHNKPTSPDNQLTSFATYHAELTAQEFEKAEMVNKL